MFLYLSLVAQVHVFVWSVYLGVLFMEYMYLYLYYLITVVFQIDCTNYIPTSSIICCDSTFSLTLDIYPLNPNFCLFLDVQWLSIMT